MDRGSINGIPVWLSVVSAANGERIALHESPGVDGAVIEALGQMPARFSLTFTLIQDGEWITDDYETASLDLRATLMAGGPYTVETPVFGELTDLWSETGYDVTYYDDQRLLVSDGSINLVQGLPETILQESAAALITTSISALSLTVGEDFSRRAPDIGFSSTAIDRLEAAADWLASVSALISNAFQPINDFSAAIFSLKSNTERLVQAPENFVSLLMSTATGLLSLIPSLSAQGDRALGSAAIRDDSTDKPTNVLVEAVETGTAFDSGLPSTAAETFGEEASDFDLAEQDEVNASVSVVMSAVTASVCFAAIETEFATINSVLELAEALAPAFDKLLSVDDIDYRVYNHARDLWAGTRKLLTEQSADLPRLITITVARDIDIVNIVTDLYPGDAITSFAELQAAVDSIFSLNSLEDPTRIRKGSQLRYLETVT